MSKTIILIHGRDFKPPRTSLEWLWLDALRYGIERDYPAKLDAFNSTHISFVYYGDISNQFLENKTGKKVVDDTASRRRTLELLKKYKKADFGNKAIYEKLPGKDAFKEAVADTFGALLSLLRISDPLVGAVAPDMREYWNPDSQFASDVRYPLIAPLKAAINRGDRICVIAHSLGSMIAYDTFWKFCRTGEYRPRYTNKKIDLFITLGSPLADETVKRKLFGANAEGPRRYPANIVRWVNVAAEDDFISHDGEVADDYADMLRFKLISKIEDKFIYNLSLREGKSNPHHEGGYLIHPTVAAVVAGWV